MRRLTRTGTGFGALVIPAFIMTLAGCGSGAPPNSHFQGSYRSQYVVPTTNENGIFSFSVAQKGDMVGSFVDSSTNTTSAFTGTVGSDGHFHGSVNVGANVYPVTGTLNTATINGSVPGGDFQETRGTNVMQGSFSLVAAGVTPPTPAPSVSNISPFSGAYRGTYGLPVNGESGNISFTIDTAGQMTGFFSQTSSAPIRAFTATILPNGNFKTADGASISLVGTMAKSTVGTLTAGNFTLNSQPGSFEVSIGASEVDSLYQGAYFGNCVLTIATPPVTIISDLASGLVANVTFTVDKEGAVLGTINNKSFNAVITNDGRINGSVAGLTLNGKISPTFSGKTGSPGAPGGTANTGPDIVAGNFTLVDPSGVTPTSSGVLRIAADAGPTGTSVFQGSYGGVADPKMPFTSFHVPPGSSLSNNDGTVSVTIDGEGNVVGTMGGFPVKLFVTNDGQFQGSIGPDVIVGALARQQVPQPTIDNPAKQGFVAGIAGDFVITDAGKPFNGMFIAAGGNRSVKINKP